MIQNGVGALTLIQLQEDMKKQLSTQGNYTEDELEEFVMSNKKLMVDSLWKLNVVDIEATLSRVCQMVSFLSISWLKYIFSCHQSPYLLYGDKLILGASR